MFANGYAHGMSNHPLNPDPHDEPDDEGSAGDSSGTHDEIIPQDLPKGHPGRPEAEREARDGDGFVRGNV